MGFVIGIDVGSQSVKALIVDEDGHPLRRQAPLCDEPPGQRLGRAGPRRLGARAVDGGSRRFAQAGVSATDVTMLGLACQVDGVVALDRNLRPLRPGDHLARPARDGPVGRLARPRAANRC